jgi:hypothetical protein
LNGRNDIHRAVRIHARSEEADRDRSAELLISDVCHGGGQGQLVAGNDKLGEIIDHGDGQVGGEESAGFQGFKGVRHEPPIGRCNPGRE